MPQKIAILDDSILDTLLEQQQQILNLLKGKSNSNSEFCSVGEAAKILNLSDQKIRYMVDTDKLKYKKFGRTIRIYRSCLV